MIIDGWQVFIPAAAEQQRQAVLDKLDQVDIDEIPANALGQSIAQEIVEALSEVKRWMAEVETVSKELRTPYFEQAKKIKATSDTFLLPVAQRFAQVDRKLAEYEAEKKRIEIQLERQRQAEADRLRREEEAKQRAAEEERRRQEQAERDRLAEIQRKALEATNAKLKAEAEEIMRAERERQAAAEAQREAERQAERDRLTTVDSQLVKYDAPKTDGVSVKVAYEFDITDPLALLVWCKANGRGWYNPERLADCFFKRDVMEAINSPGFDYASVPGLTVRKVVSSTVRKAKGPKVVNVSATRVEL